VAQKIALSLNVFSTESLSQQLFASLQVAIASGRIRSGEKLPSIREMSKQLQISTITVRDAIDKLAEIGFVEARHGSGNYVTAPVSSSEIAPAFQAQELKFTQSTYESADWELSDKFTWSAEAQNINQSFNDSSFHPWWDLAVDYDFRVYQPGHEAAQGIHWNKIIEQHFNGKAMHKPLGGFPQGNLSLRRHLCRWLNRTCALAVLPDDIFLVSGAQQARDLVAGMLIEDKNTVVVEEPGSITDLLAYSSKGAQLIHVGQDQNGIDFGLLSAVKGASVAHLITGANFPTGVSLSPERANQIIEWALHNNVILVEDSYGAGFVYQDSPLTSLLGSAGESVREQIIYIGSLSQLFNPALRFAYVVVPKKLQGRFLCRAELAGSAPSALSQSLLLNYFEQDYFSEDVLRVTQAARLRRQALLRGLADWPRDLISFEPVRGGFHQTVWFNQSVDDLRIFEKALVAGIGVVPLSPYYHGASGLTGSGISLSFAQMSEERILAGLERLLPVVEECRQSQI